jgi:hypothetical protein
MSVQQMMRRATAPEPRRRGRPTKAEVAVKAQAAKAVALLAGLDACNFSWQGRVSADM